MWRGRPRHIQRRSRRDTPSLVRGCGGQAAVPVPYGGHWLPGPELRAVTQPGRIAPRGVPTITSAGAKTSLLRWPEEYSLFIKPVGGTYSLSITSADAVDPATD